MKKLLLLLLTICFVLVIIVTVSIMNNTRTLSEIQKQNEVYEQYLNKEVYGTEVVTIINKATNANVQNEIEKDEKGYFIENATNSVKVEIKMLDEGKLVAYPMETIQKVGVEGFIKNFNLIVYKCSKIEYHETTKKVSKIIFEQIEE